MMTAAAAAYKSYNILLTARLTLLYSRVNTVTLMKFCLGVLVPLL